MGEYHRLGHLLQGIRVVLLLLLGHVPPVPRSHVAAALPSWGAEGKGDDGEEGDDGEAAGGGGEESVG